ncbi:hypothetical protein LINPERHAP1_LOCUS27790 [Linum perenne]
MTKTGTKRPRDGVAGSSATPVNTPPSAGATNPGHSRRISPPLKTRSQVSPGANIVGGRNMQSPPKKNLEHGSPAGQRIPTKHTYKRRKSIAHKSDKPTGLMMPRTSNVGNPQHQVTEEHTAKSVDEETESDNSDFVILHKVPHVHKGKHPRSSFQNSKSEIGGPSSRTRGKTTGCNPTNILDKAMRDKVEGAGKGKVRVDVTEMVNVESNSPRNAPFPPIPSKLYQKGDSPKVASTSTPIVTDAQTPQTPIVHKNVCTSPCVTPQFDLGIDQPFTEYGAQVSTKVIDEYTDILNLQQMTLHNDRPKRWVCSLQLAGCIHASIKREEIRLDLLLNAFLDTLDVKEALMEVEFDQLKFGSV